MALNAWKEGTRQVNRCYINNGLYIVISTTLTNTNLVYDISLISYVLLEDGARYSTINIGRCPLSAVIDTGSRDTIGSDPMVSLVVKGCGNLNPPEPKMFRIFKKWGKNTRLSLINVPRNLRYFKA